MSFLRSKYARVLAVVLALQFAVFYVVAVRAEDMPVVAPLSVFPQTVGQWRLYQESKIDQETLDVLKADDTLNRSYLDANGHGAYLFIAFFKTQREGQAPHSPKNCLPGAGFEPLESFPIDITVEGRPEPIHVNRFLTARGEEKSVTLYWYQNRSRIIASEFAAKFWLIADSIRYRHSDCALVKVVVPVRGEDAQIASATAVQFTQDMFPAIARQLPM
jgi:EpsI family protein